MRKIKDLWNEAANAELEAMTAGIHGRLVVLGHYKDWPLDSKETMISHLKGAAKTLEIANGNPMTRTEIDFAIQRLRDHEKSPKYTESDFGWMFCDAMEIIEALDKYAEDLEEELSWNGIRS